ncbi:hypothetical protein BJY52DRAFT_1420407 [Lactarius psammicola]|nr:hypothetical protein BJY52DRAFT_1420407 [Lactarius psammicola]
MFSDWGHRGDSNLFRRAFAARLKGYIAFLSLRLGVLSNILSYSLYPSYPASTPSDLSTHATARAAPRKDGFDKFAEANLKRSVEMTNSARSERSALFLLRFANRRGLHRMCVGGGGVFEESLINLSKEMSYRDRTFGSPPRRMSCIPVMAPTRQNLSKTLSYTLSLFVSAKPIASRYQFIGRILGKALYKGILVDIAFTGFFLAKRLGKQSFLDDLTSLDPDLYQGLLFLRHYPGVLSLNFTIADEEFGVARTIDLKPNGSNIPVTRDNELEMFNQQELQVLFSGMNTPIDIENLRRNMNYGGLYSNEEPTIRAFWKVVEGFDAEQRRALLHFVTSVGRPPLYTRPSPPYVITR